MQKFLRSAVAGLALCLLGAVPATASAGILYSGASEVPVGTNIVGKSSSVPKFYSGGTVYIECSGANLAGTVASNGSESSESNVGSLSFFGSASEGKCPHTAGAVQIVLDTPSCLRYDGLSKWLIKGGACLTEPKTLYLTFTWSWGKCRYRGNASTTFTSNVNSEPLVLKQSAEGQLFMKTEGGIFCPPNMTLKDLNLQLETAAGSGLKVIK